MNIRSVIQKNCTHAVTNMSHVLLSVNTIQRVIMLTL